MHLSIKKVLNTRAPMQVNAYSWQLLQAVAYLHRHQIGHRDISLENILLKDGNVRLMDFGMAVRSETDAGTALRYFKAVGKESYRAPECYVPLEPEIGVLVPAGAQPGDIVSTVVRDRYLCEMRMPSNAVPGDCCLAEVWGYAAAPADIWSAGVCIVIMLLGGPAWNLSVLADDLFRYVRDAGLATLLQHWRKPAFPNQAQLLVDAMLGPQPGGRPTAKDCLAMSWFEAKRKAPVPVHLRACLESDMAAAGGA